ncbi:MAG: hypothetical protein J5526_07925 [Bacteroidales bacterium]|nr:hypothetical protein [Bacteroidales bacterium]
MRQIQLLITAMAMLLVASCATAQSESKAEKKKKTDTYAVEQVIVRDMPSLGEHIIIRPNAKKNHIRLRREQSNDVIYYELRDRDEKPIARGTWNTVEYRLDMEPFAPGVYYLKLYNYQDMQLMYRITKTGE